MNISQGQKPDEPVAYDVNGNPLYATPQSEQSVVHVSRSVNPVKQDVAPEIQKKHEESKRKFPHLNLSEAEYVIRYVRRHPIGMFGVVFTTVFVVAVVASLLANYESVLSLMGVVEGVNYGIVFLLGILLIILALIGGYIGLWVYLSNQFFLTNESVIQEIQTSLFAHREQTVSLANIEDVSYRQTGILQLLLNYGSIRLSTEGDETTYRFAYVARPREETAALNNAVEAFKNGRPVDDN